MQQRRIGQVSDDHVQQHGYNQPVIPNDDHNDNSQQSFFSLSRLISFLSSIMLSSDDGTKNNDDQNRRISQHQHGTSSWLSSIPSIVKRIIKIVLSAPVVSLMMMVPVLLYSQSRLIYLSSQYNANHARLLRSFGRNQLTLYQEYKETMTRRVIPKNIINTASPVVEGYNINHYNTMMKNNKFNNIVPLLYTTGASQSTSQFSQFFQSINRGDNTGQCCHNDDEKHYHNNKSWVTFPIEQFISFLEKKWAGKPGIDGQHHRVNYQLDINGLQQYLSDNIAENASRDELPNNHDDSFINNAHFHRFDKLAFYVPPITGQNPDDIVILNGGNGMVALDWLETISVIQNLRHSSSTSIFNTFRPTKPWHNVGFFLIDMPSYGYNKGSPSLSTITDNISDAIVVLSQHLFTIDRRSNQMYNISFFGFSLGCSGALIGANFIIDHNTQRISETKDNVITSQHYDPINRLNVKTLILASPFSTMTDVATDLTKLPHWLIDLLLQHKFNNETLIKALLHKTKTINIRISHSLHDEIISYKFGEKLFLESCRAIRYEQCQTLAEQQAIKGEHCQSKDGQKLSIDSITSLFEFDKLLAEPVSSQQQQLPLVLNLVDQSTFNVLNIDIKTIKERISPTLLGPYGFSSPGYIKSYTLIGHKNDQQDGNSVDSVIEKCPTTNGDYCHNNIVFYQLNNGGHNNQLGLRYAAHELVKLL